MLVISIIAFCDRLPKMCVTLKKIYLLEIYLPTPISQLGKPRIFVKTNSPK